MDFIKVLRAEIYKLLKSRIWPILLIAPLFGGFVVYSYATFSETISTWIDMYSRMIGVYGLYLLPLLTGLIAAWICRYEYSNDGWQQYLSEPVRRWQVYVVKFILAAALIAFIQLLMLAVLVVAGTITGIEEPAPFKPILASLFGGWFSAFPLLALQLWLSTAWSSFAWPMAVNVVLTLPSLFIAGHATLSAYYPWAQPLLAMDLSSGGMEVFTRISTETLIFVIIGSFIVFFIGGMASFQRRSY